ncbi:Titin [Halotydeus destructor]|nr:Titin [Halotydeus destructor]
MADQGHDAPRPTTPGGTLVPHPPEFKVSLKENVELLEGTTVRYEIVVRAVPSPSIAVFKDGQPLEENDRISVIYETPEVLELVLEHVLMEDSGEYKVVATNSEGEAESSGVIAVTKDKVLFMGMEDTGLVEEGMEPNDINVTDILNSRLGVETPTGSGSRPRTPAFKWFRDGQQFDASERFQCQFDDSEDTIALLFQHVTPDDAGLYTCVASTTSGKISCSAELTVQGDVHRLLRTPEPPAIMAEITPIEVQQGTSAMLEAKVSGYPQPKVNWFKDDEEMVADERHKFLKEDEESYTMVIKNVQKEDAGIYVLKGENDLGEIKTAGELKVNYAPKFTKEMGNKDANVDDAIKLEVMVDASPAPSVQWYKDGQLITQTEQIHTIQEAEGKFVLLIDNASVSDTGSYSVVVSNSSGQQTGFSKVTVTAPPKVEAVMKDFDGQAGDNAEFTIKLSGSPKPTVQFLKDKKVLELDDEHVSLAEADGTYTLTIKNIGEADAGLYTCKATNDHGTKECSASLGLRSPPKFKRGLNDFEARDGDVNVDFTVVIEGSPKPSVKWYYDEKEVTESETYKRVDEDGTTYILRITKVTTEMTGMYTCEATNTEGQAKSSAKLTVNAKPKFVTELKDVALKAEADLTLTVKTSGYPKPAVQWAKDGKVVVETDHIKLTDDDESGDHSLIISGATDADVGEYKATAKNPKFTVGLSDVNAFQDQENITLTVETEISPVKPKLRWFVDDIEIVEADKRYQLVDEPEKDKYSLVIKQANEGTAGTYKCNAANDAGEVETQCEMAVTSKPEFMQGLEDRDAVEGDLIVMDIVVAGSPTPKIKFLKDGKELSLGDSTNLKIEQESDLVYIITIPKANKDSAGNYEVVVSNKVGEARTKGSLAVMTKPVFVQDLMDKSATVGEDEFIEVIVDACPRPSLVWYKNGKLITTTVTAENTDNKFRLRFEPVEIEDNAEFYCEAKNKVGTTASRKAKFVVKDAGDTAPPTIDKPLANIAIVGGDAVRLDVKVSGNPMPAITWLKNGQEIVDPRLVIKDEGSGDHCLTIRRSQDGDAGQYSVIAKNRIGEVKSEANLIIQEPMQPTVDGLQDIEVDYLSCGQLEATITGVPSPNVTWLKDGKELSFDDNVVYTKGDNDVHKLVIRLATDTNVGKYSVQASNSAGVAGGVASLTIRPRPPSFVGGKENYTVDIGQPLTIDVKVAGYPFPKVTWEKEDSEIGDDGKRRILAKDGDHKLVLKSVGQDDIGTYRLIASNSMGDESIVINVGQTAVEPSILKRLPEKMDFTGGDDLRLEGRIGGTPPPESKWLRNGIEVVADGNRIQIDRKPDGTVSLCIKDSGPDDTGRYELVASNSLGRKSTGSDVTVSAKPRLRSGLLEKDFDLHDELGRGTQGITSSGTEKGTGKKYAIKAMHGKDKMTHDWMIKEYDNMNGLPPHHRLVNLYAAYKSADRDSLYLVNDHCPNGHLLDYMLKRGPYTENDVRRYIRQTLEGIDFMHQRNMGHFGITIGNILVDGTEGLRLNDFSLSHRLTGRSIRIEHGHPEFVAPEIIDNQAVSLKADMWSVGVLTYLLLSGRSPFLAETDRDTLKNIEKQKLHFKHEAFTDVSAEAKNFISCLLDWVPENRLTVREALEHSWLRIDVNFGNDKQLTTSYSNLREYDGRWRSWYANASCTKYFRRRALDTCFVHKSRMIYPPEEPVGSTDKKEREPIKFEFERHHRSNLVDISDMHSESHYTQGPDTYLLQHRDVDYPLRVRQYLRVGAAASPSFAKQLQSGHWGELNLGKGHFSPQVAVKERRKFNEVLEEIGNEIKTGQYHQSSRLTRIQKKLDTEPGVPRIGNVEIDPRTCRARSIETRDLASSSSATAASSSLYHQSSLTSSSVTSNRLQLPQ